MRVLMVLAAANVAALCACAKEVPPGQEKLFARVDCQLIDNPELTREFDQAKAICVGRAEAAAIAGTAGMPTGRGLGGAIASGVQQGMTQNQITLAVGTSCMAEQGYLMRTRDEHVAACAAVRAHREEVAAKAAPAAKKRK